MSSQRTRDEFYQEFLAWTNEDIPDHDESQTCDMGGSEATKITKEGGKPVEVSSIAAMV